MFTHYWLIYLCQCLCNKLFFGSRPRKVLFNNKKIIKLIIKPISKQRKKANIHICLSKFNRKSTNLKKFTVIWELSLNRGKSNLQFTGFWIYATVMTIRSFYTYLSMCVNARVLQREIWASFTFSACFHFHLSNCEWTSYSDKFTPAYKSSIWLLKDKQKFNINSLDISSTLHDFFCWKSRKEEVQVNWKSFP